MAKQKRMWVFSDTHGNHRDLVVPNDIDIAICSGDVGQNKDLSLNDAQVADFMYWYESLGIEYKLFIPGNHDTSIEAGMLDASHYPSVAVLLHDVANVDGLQVFGSPYTPAFCNWAYGLDESKINDAWACIPYKVDVVVTHGPPRGILDTTDRGKHIGCEHLRDRIKEVTPKFHIFGHNHNRYGTVATVGETVYINASILNEAYTKVTNGVVLSV